MGTFNSSVHIFWLQFCDFFVVKNTVKWVCSKGLRWRAYSELCEGLLANFILFS